MRFKTNPPKERKVGEKRIVEKFLFFPKKLPLRGSGTQMRWLERARWMEEFRYSFGQSYTDDHYFWYPIHWIEDY